MAKKEKTIIEKVQKELPEFADIALGMSLEELEKRISSEAKNRVEVERAKKENEALLSAKEVVKELSAPFSDAVKVINMKIELMTHLVKEKGGNV